MMGGYLMKNNISKFTLVLLLFIFSSPISYFTHVDVQHKINPAFDEPKW